MAGSIVNQTDGNSTVILPEAESIHSYYLITILVDSS